MKKISFVFIVLFCTFLSSCSNYGLYEELEVNKKGCLSEKILSFSNKESFNIAYRTNNFTPPTRTFNDTIYAGGYFSYSTLRAGGSKSIGNISLEELVPDSRLANMLNSKGEIIINDTLYKVTKDGTFYTAVNNKKDLEHYASNFDLIRETFLGNDLYKYKDVYRYDTYKGVDFTMEETFLIRDASDFNDGIAYVNTINDNNNSNLNLRSTPKKMLQDINIINFKETNPHAENFISKLWANGGGRISNIYKLSSTRRLNAEVYDYNNVFAHSVGITAKVQKKMWYQGWAKLKNWGRDGLRIGFQNTLIRTNLRSFYGKIPDFFFVKNTETDDNIFERCKRIVYYKNGIEHELPQADIIMGPLNYGGMYSYSAYPYIVLFSGTMIYEFHPNFWGKNKENNSEINFRFDEGFNTLIIGAKNISPYDLTFNNDSDDLLNFAKNNLIISSQNTPKKKLIKGTFYAAVKYNNKWYGLKMNW